MQKIFAFQTAAALILLLALTAGATEAPLAASSPAGHDEPLIMQAGATGGHLVLRSQWTPKDCREEGLVGPAPHAPERTSDPLDGPVVPLGQTLPSFEACQGLRPGARMTAPSGCTLNFVFSQGGDLFIGTAAHCVGGTGQRVSAAGVGDFGAVVFDGWENNPSAIANDFALIKIDAQHHDDVDPALCTWGGPTGIGSPGSLLDTDLLLEYGWGSATSIAAASRARIHDEFLSSSNTLSWNGVGSGGDSGAPLVYGDGRAAGIHTAGLTPVAGVVLEQGPTIERILDLTSDGGFNLQLETAPTQWTVPV